MTRKRFIKLIMSQGWSRNEANELADFLKIHNRNQTKKKGAADGEVKRSIDGTVDAVAFGI